ncbi:MAG: alpha/beta hydrolase [Burkholderiaceae bacterium]|nr:alpha/beta hydrolase [Burkholderiaceae bacterium]
MKFQKKHADLPAGRLQYLCQGSGRPLLCLHPASGVRITQASEQLAESFSVYLPILPGFDETPLLNSEAGMAELAQLVAEFIEVVIGSRADVAGHSFGGWVASWLAVLRPDLVGRLVLQCPAGFRPEGKAGPETDPVKLLAQAYAHPEKRRSETKSAEVTAANRRLFSIYSAGAASDHALIDRLDEIQADTLILRGLKDGVIPEESAQLLKRLIPRSRLVHVDDAAHNLEVDQPEEYVRLVKDFLAASAKQTMPVQGQTR